MTLLGEAVPPLVAGANGGPLATSVKMKTTQPHNPCVHSCTRKPASPPKSPYAPLPVSLSLQSMKHIQTDDSVSLMCPGDMPEETKRQLTQKEAREQWGPAGKGGRSAKLCSEPRAPSPPCLGGRTVAFLLPPSTFPLPSTLRGRLWTFNKGGSEQVRPLPEVMG